MASFYFNVYSQFLQGDFTVLAAEPLIQGMVFFYLPQLPTTGTVTVTFFQGSCKMGAGAHKTKLDSGNIKQS